MPFSPNVLTPDQLRRLRPELVAEIEQNETADQRRAEWLNLKRGKLGASSAWKFWTPKLAEANNATVRGYIIEKAAEMDGFKSFQIKAGAVRHGNDEELPGSLDFMERSGLKLTHYGNDQEWLSWAENDQVGCTPDARIFCKQLICPFSAQVWENVTIPFEQKNHATIAAYEKFAAMRDGRELIETDYKYGIQVQHQMLVMDAPMAVFQSRYTEHTSGKAQSCYFLVPRLESFTRQHAERLHRAVTERDEQRKARAGRKAEQLTTFIKQ